MLVVGDVHGCFLTLLRLMEQFPTGEEVVFVGDLIDRGPASIKVLDFVRTGKYKCCMGNHEHLMLDYNERIERCYPYGCWLENGGDTTDREYIMLGDGDKFRADLDWIAALPSYLEFHDIKLGERHLFVSHAAPRSADYNEIPLSRMDSIIWSRHNPYENEDKYCVYGHTPQKKLKVGDTHTNIDTGAAYNSRGYGTLSAISFPSLQVYQQEYIG